MTAILIFLSYEDVGVDDTDQYKWLVIERIQLATLLTSASLYFSPEKHDRWLPIRVVLLSSSDATALNFNQQKYAQLQCDTFHIKLFYSQHHWRLTVLGSFNKIHLLS